MSEATSSGAGVQSVATLPFSSCKCPIQNDILVSPSVIFPPLKTKRIESLVGVNFIKLLVFVVIAVGNSITP